MAEMDCARLHEVGAELALGVLPGRDRATAMAHVQDCVACEQHVRELAAVGDRLVGLAPGAEPPVGFEQRVMRRLGFSPRWRRWLAIAAAVVLAVCFGAGGWLLHSVVHDDLTSTTIMSDGHQVGEAFAYTDHRPWVYVELVELPTGGPVFCEIELADGRTVTIGSFPLSGGSGAWAGPAPLAGTELVEVRILGEDGALLGAGRMH